jgi:hypothetical protein
MALRGYILEGHIHVHCKISKVHSQDLVPGLSLRSYSSESESLTPRARPCYDATTVFNYLSITNTH